MTEDVHLTIDGNEVVAPEGSTLMEAAGLAGIATPTICYHPATTSNGLCRLCVVEVEGQRLLQPACIVRASEGQKVHTNTERVRRSRRTILEMLAATMDLSESPEIQQMILDTGADSSRFPDSMRRESQLLDDNPMYVRDYSKCLLCWRCVQVCAEDAQYTFALSYDGRGYSTQIGTFFDRPIPETSCVLCGQCVAVCPTGALLPKREFLLQQGRRPDELGPSTAGKRRRRAGRPDRVQDDPPKPR